jgi:hypothetical protein
MNTTLPPLPDLPKYHVCSSKDESSKTPRPFMQMERGPGHASLKGCTRHLFTRHRSLGVSFRRVLREFLLVQALDQPPEVSFTPQPSSLIRVAFCNPYFPMKRPASTSNVLIGRFTSIAWHQTRLVQRKNPQRSYMKRGLNQDLFDKEVYNTACSLLAVLNHSCSELHFQTDFKLILFSHKILAPAPRRPSASPPEPPSNRSSLPYDSRVNPAPSTPNPKPQALKPKS